MSMSDLDILLQELAQELEEAKVDHMRVLARLCKLRLKIAETRGERDEHAPSR